MDNKESIFEMCYGGDYSSVKVTLNEKKSLITNMDEFGRSMLFCAACGGNVDLVRFLISIKLPVNARDAIGFTPLMGATMGRHVEVIKILLTAGADVNNLTLENKSAFFDACFRNDLEICKLLVTYQADINVPDIFGSTPLHVVALKNNVEVLKFLLLQENLNIAAQNRLGQTALDIAYEKGHEVVVALLIVYGAIQA